jgi:hypothetical protein
LKPSRLPLVGSLIPEKPLPKFGALRAIETDELGTTGE